MLATIIATVVDGMAVLLGATIN